MDYLGSLYALLTAAGFKATELTKRLLQEKGASEIDTYTIYRYALIPAIIWSLIFVRKEDLIFIANSVELLIIFGLIILLWNLQALLMSFVINSTSSMILFTTICNLLTLPLFLGFGVLYNKDIPSLLGLAALLILFIALLIKPSPHHENLRPRLSKPLYIILFLILAKVVCDAVLQGISREALQQISPPVFLGVFSVTTLSVCALIAKLYIKPRFKETEVIKEKQWLALFIPLGWFAASIPEAYALAAIPIYTFVAIGVITFGMDTVSDLIHKRIRLNVHTMAFITLVVSGTVLTIFSV